MGQGPGGAGCPGEAVHANEAAGTCPVASFAFRRLTEMQLLDSDPALRKPGPTRSSCARPIPSPGRRS